MGVPSRPVASECTVCLDCLASCPQTGYGFRLHLKPAARLSMVAKLVPA